LKRKSSLKKLRKKISIVTIINNNMITQKSSNSSATIQTTTSKIHATFLLATKEREREIRESFFFHFPIFRVFL